MDAQAIREALDEAKRRKIRVSPYPTNRASDIGHDCLRFLVMCRLRWRDRLPHDVGLQYVFDEGNLHEPAMNRALEEAGFVITQTQRSYHIKSMGNKKIDMSGHIDGFCQHPIHIPIEIPFEGKTMSPYNWSSISDYDSVLNNKRYYIRKYAGQVQSYMLMTNNEEGVFFFKNKVSGQMKPVPCDLDYEYAESLLQKAETINEYVDREDIDAPATDDIEICERCGFRHICFSGRDWGAGVQMIDDESLGELLERRDEVKDSAEEYKKIDGQVKAQFKAKAEELGEKKAEFIVGDFFARCSRSTRAKYEFPDEVKEQYKTDDTVSWRTDIGRVG